VAPSGTLIDDQFAIRAAIVNHRTAKDDVDALLAKTIELGRVITASAEMSWISGYSSSAASGQENYLRFAPTTQVCARLPA
jgi:hypothetical protein